MMWLVAFLACFGLIHSEESFNHPKERVIRSMTTGRGSWKWQVSVQYKSNNEEMYNHICGGAIVDAFFILTAANCIISTDPDQYRVVVGEYVLYEYEGSEQYCRVESITVHPSWDGNPEKGFDIALLRLTDPIYDNGYEAIANLPAIDESLPHDFPCSVTGWDYRGYSFYEMLQEATVRVVEHAVCSQPDWWGSLAQESMVCAGGDGISGCQGNSGGLLNCLTDGNFKVYGVASFGPSGGCNQKTKPTVFTRVSAFVDWIYRVIHGLE